MKLFEKVATSKKEIKTLAPKDQPLAGSSGNANMMDKIEELLQKEPEEIQRERMLSRKFDDDYKKVKKKGKQTINYLSPIPQKKPQFNF